MVRSVALVAVPLLILGLANLERLGADGQPAPKKPDTSARQGEASAPKQAPVAEMTTRELVALLAEPIDVKVFQAPMNLKEAIDLLSRKAASKGKDLAFVIDRNGFRDENPEAPDIHDAQVKFPPFPSRMSVGDALRGILRKVPTNNATFVVRPGFVEITTHDRANSRKGLQEKVMVSFYRRPLVEALEELSDRTGVSIVTDMRVRDRLQTGVTATFGNNVTLEAALRILTDMADLKLVLFEECGYVTSAANAHALERERHLREEYEWRRMWRDIQPPQPEKDRQPFPLPGGLGGFGGGFGGFPGGIPPLPPEKDRR
ncbi:MAG: hypothetical protein L0Z62_12710 [Gemmataceae bacterium]|nr:hypothetical protein [Gemmataceae bacterium]